MGKRDKNKRNDLGIKLIKENLISAGIKEDIAQNAIVILASIYRYNVGARERQILDDLLHLRGIAHSSLDAFYMQSEVREGLRVLEKNNYIKDDNGYYIFTNKVETP